MDPSGTEINFTPTNGENPLSHDEIDISLRVAERRKQLGAYATNTQEVCEESEYKSKIATSVEEMCKELERDVTGSPNELMQLPKECEASIKQDHHSLLFDNPEPIYKSISLVKWLKHLPILCEQFLGGTSFRLNYQSKNCIWMVAECVRALKIIQKELESRTGYEGHRIGVDGNPIAISDEVVERIRSHLDAAVSAWHALNVDPKAIAEELLAIILYTIKLKKEDWGSIVVSSKIHGHSPSLYAVMNCSVRVYRDSDQKLDDQDKYALKQTILLFLPLLARIDVLLSRLPLDRTVFFRGIEAHGSTKKYKSGALISWTQLSSTSADFNIAHDYGDTIFIAHVHNAPAIDFGSVSPKEDEHLLPSYTWVEVVNFMSPTLLRILSSPCDYITVKSAGDQPNIEEVVKRLIPHERQLRIFEKFDSKYVLASVHPAPPPQTNVEPLFEEIRKFLKSEPREHLLLLGSSGSGKSSALLAVYCMLNRESRELVRGKTDQNDFLIPVFIPLPSVDFRGRGLQALDLALLQYLGVSEDQLELILKRHRVVILLDSLDECREEVSKLFPLLDGTRYCQRARVIVSCRTEYFSNITSPSSAIAKSTNVGSCRVLHVQPFSTDQVESFLEKAKSSNNRSISLDDLHSAGVTSELQSLPVALQMGVDIVRHRSRNESNSDKSQFLDFECPIGTRIGLYHEYLNCYRIRQKRKKVDGIMRDDVEELSQPRTACLRKAFQDMAVQMLAQGNWSMSLSVVQSIFEKCFNNSEDEVRSALKHSPVRLESLEDLDAACSFWHKSIGEFLCAAALCGNDAKRYLEMTGQGGCSAFSKRELGVLSFFNELATPIDRCKQECCKTLCSALKERRNQSNPEVATAGSSEQFKAVIVSNAMALLAISQYPFQNTNLHNLTIKDCLLYEGNFRNAKLDGTRFENCDVNRSDFEGAYIKGAEFLECTFGAVQQAPLRGHAKIVCSVCWSLDGKRIASGSSDKSIRVWEVASGDVVQILEGHTEAVLSVSWSSDNTRIASGSSDKSIRVWEVTSGDVVQTLEGHTEAVLSVSWSSDNKRVASGSRDNTIRVWDVANGDVLGTLEGHTGWVQSVCWSPDDKWVASGSWDLCITVWDSASGDVFRTLEGHTGWVQSVCWSPDGKLVASGSSDKSIRVWEVASGDVVQTLERHTERVMCVSWSPDGKLVASGSYDMTVRLWEVASGDVVQTLEGHTERVMCVSWSSDSKRVASGSWDKTVRVWEVASGREVKKLEGHTDWVRNVSWSLDSNQVTSGSDDNSIRVWELVSGREVKKLEGHTNDVNNLCWSPDGKLVASGSDENSIRVWEVASGQEVKKLEGHTNYVWSVYWSPDGKLVASGSHDNSIRMWEVASGREVKKLEGHTSSVWSVCWSPDGKLVASGSSDKSIRVWEVASGWEVKRLEGHTNDVNSVCWSPDGKLVASGSSDKSIRVWEVASGREVKKLEGHTSSVWSVSWSSDSKLVASGSGDNSVRVWEVASGREVKKLEGHTDGVSIVCWNPDGKLVASGSSDKSIRVWEVASGREVKKLEGHTESVASVCWSPDGKLVASGSSDKSIRVWKVASGREVKKLEGHTKSVRSVCWSPDGKLIASGSYDMTVRVWVFASRREVKKLEGHTKSVASVCWSPDGKLIASGSYDMTVRVWEVASGDVVQTLEGHTEAVLSVSWSSDNKCVASGSWDKTVRVWDVASGDVLCTLEGHNHWVQSVCWSPTGNLLASGSSDNTVRVWEVFREVEDAAQTNTSSIRTSSLILGRQPAGIPPFKVKGELGRDSQSNRFLSEHIFKTTPD